MTNPDANLSGNTEVPDDLETADGVDRWLRRELGRQLILVLVVPPDQEADPRLLALRLAIACYREVRAIAADTGDLGGNLRAAVRADVDAVLVWVAAGPATATGQPSEVPWLRAALGEIEDVGLRDRAFVALVGPTVTRPWARAAGYEDGWGDEPASALVARLAREAVRRDEYLRQGSSPPCYLE